MKDVALLILRLVTGGLLMGHGGQKLFGWFGGPGPEGTGGWLESMGLHPGRRWAIAAGLSEFIGGLLTALGLFHPIGPTGVLSSMTMAAATAHKGKPIWVTEGGAELPVTNSAIVTAIGLAGPGRYSLDHALKTRVPRGILAVVLSAALMAVLIGASGSSQMSSE